MAEADQNLRIPISGTTRIAAVIGNPVRHSLSPALLNAAFNATGLDWAFVALEVEAGDAARALDGLRALRLAGLSVTMPHKAAVAALMDRRSGAAERLEAVNCVVVEDGLLVGHNTDGDGFLDGLAHDSSMDVAGCTAVVVGAGGAARAIVLALGGAGASEVSVVNRTAGRAEAAALLAGGAGRAVSPSDAAEAISAAALVVNATPVGMGAAPDLEGPMPLDPGLLSTGQVVVDLVYHPLDTPWLVEARRQGIEAHGGLSMLVFQAARAFALWTGRDAPVDAMSAAARAALGAYPSS